MIFLNSLVLLLCAPTTNEDLEFIQADELPESIVSWSDADGCFDEFNNHCRTQEVDGVVDVELVNEFWFKINKKPKECDNSLCYMYVNGKFIKRSTMELRFPSCSSFFSAGSSGLSYLFSGFSCFKDYFEYRGSDEKEKWKLKRNLQKQMEDYKVPKVLSSAMQYSLRNEICINKTCDFLKNYSRDIDIYISPLNFIENFDEDWEVQFVGIIVNFNSSIYRTKHCKLKKVGNKVYYVGFTI